MQVSGKLIAALHALYLFGAASGAYYADEAWERIALVVGAWLIWPLLRAFKSIGESVSEPAAEHLRSKILGGGR